MLYSVDAQNRKLPKRGLDSKSLGLIRRLASLHTSMRLGLKNYVDVCVYTI